MELFDFEADNVQILSEVAAIDEMLEKLKEISPDARDDASHALLYGFSEYLPAHPPLKAIRRFVENILSAAEKTGNILSEEARRVAEQVRCDRLDPDTEQVQAAAFKVVREFDRLRGILRFKPLAAAEESPVIQKSKSRYTAFCAPDHFVLPLFAGHFWQRFGNTSWAIIDEKRKLGLFSEHGKKPALLSINTKKAAITYKANSEHKKSSDEWESLWKNYHRTINNEARQNPRLQKQFLPGRYWKYLTEM